ncbi:MAG TPA: hypothetical protein VG649_18370 [Candidatus Angelobacter sp.]|nr:hypothetical protein [Candidatus Angelobacter sp.]
MQGSLKKLVLNQEALKNLGSSQPEDPNAGEANLSLTRPPICEFTNTIHCR